MAHAVHRCMGAKRYQDLVVWQIGDELRREVYRLTGDGGSARDFRFREQLRQAAGGVCTNIAEGFGRLGAREFVQFLRYAYASALETAQWIDDGLARKHWTPNEVADVRRILERLKPPLLRLIRYLRTPEAEARSRTLATRPNPLAAYEPSDSYERQRPEGGCRRSRQEIAYDGQSVRIGTGWRGEFTDSGAGGAGDGATRSRRA